MTTGPVVTASPPPLPGEAFALTMEAQSESGMVITDSGIIILDPNSLEARSAEAAARASTKAADSAWALPAFAKPGAANEAPTPRTDLASDWDTVLARARDRLTPPVPPGSNKSRK